jgi:hypothetical protein
VGDVNTLYKKPDPQPITVEATLIWKLPDRLVALDAKGYLYTWFTKPTKQLGFSVEEGCMMYVHADEISRDVYQMYPKGASEAEGTASEGEHER